jgi:hypothetical protein
MACHIYAASDGPAARRVKPEMSVEQLRSISNGIWMCYTHGKLIDTDEATYMPDVLNYWRALAERKAQLRQKLGREISFRDVWGSGFTLPDDKTELTDVGKVHQVIERAFVESCLSEIWGDNVANSVREFSIEIARNALSHGGASKFQLIIEPNRIVLTDNGGPFSLTELLLQANGRGGRAAANAIQTELKDEVLCSYIRRNDENAIIVALIRTVKEISTVTTCSVFLDNGPGIALETHRFCEMHSECETVYLLPKYGLAHSDVPYIAQASRDRIVQGQRIVLVCANMSQHLERWIKEEYPELHLMILRGSS